MNKILLIFLVFLTMLVISCNPRVTGQADSSDICPDTGYVVKDGCKIPIQELIYNSQKSLHTSLQDAQQLCEKAASLVSEFSSDDCIVKCGENCNGVAQKRECWSGEVKAEHLVKTDSGYTVNCPSVEWVGCNC